MGSTYVRLMANSVYTNVASESATHSTILFGRPLKFATSAGKGKDKR